MPSQAADAVVVDPWIRRCGMAALLAACVRTAGSYGVEPYPHGLSAIRLRLGDLAIRLGASDGRWWAHVLTGDIGPAAVNLIVFAVLPLLVSSAAFVVLYLRLTRAREIHPRAGLYLFRWAVVLAVCQAAAMPGVEDFWVYLAEGRMVTDGVNPYVITSQNYLGMAYGPLWALIGAGIYGIAGSIPLAAVLGKAVMLASWVAALAVVRRLTSGGARFEQCAGVLIFGWLPLSADQSIAEGHNDILLVLGMLLWLLWLERDRRISANLALTASVLIKLVSAPLAVLSIMRARFARASGATLLVEWGAPVIAAAGLWALFATDLSILTPLWATHDMSGYRPADALAALAPVIGARASGALAVAVRGAFLVFAVAGVARYWRVRTDVQGRVAALAIMLAMLFASDWRVFPWYLLWPLGLAAVAFQSVWSRWTVGVALLMPVLWMRVFLVEFRPFDAARDGVLLLAVYLAGWAWVWLTRAPVSRALRSM